MTVPTMIVIAMVALVAIAVPTASTAASATEAPFTYGGTLMLLGGVTQGAMPMYVNLNTGRYRYDYVGGPRGIGRGPCVFGYKTGFAACISASQDQVSVVMKMYTLTVSIR